MKAITLLVLLAIGMTACAVGQTAETVNSSEVPDAATAIELDKKALIGVYGKKVIESEEPFKASLSDGVWHVSGTLYCRDKAGNVTKDTCLGGVAMADIRQSDGRVLRTGHGR